MVRKTAPDRDGQEWFFFCRFHVRCGKVKRYINGWPLACRAVDVLIPIGMESRFHAFVTVFTFRIIMINRLDFIPNRNYNQNDESCIPQTSKECGKNQRKGDKQ